MNQATLDFICLHLDDDVRKLAFLGDKHPDVDMPFALDQIRGRKMAHAKLPRWAEVDGIIYPPHISMEQCSSEQTALYKAELAARLLNLPKAEICDFSTKDTVVPEFVKNRDVSFVDLTGGFGVDFSYIADRLALRSMYVEQQTHLCKVAKENFERLGLKNIVVSNGDGVQILHSLERHLKLIFIDPARRDDAGNKVVSLQDCTPDVTLLQEEMLSKADYVIIKLSPMLDWHRAVSELNHVQEVHIVSVGNDCKELLLVLSEKKESSRRVFCYNEGQQFVFEEDAESAVSIVKPEEVGGYLYEPNASLMKAGCFGAISERYGMKMLAKNSHLFVSGELVPDFPGRSFHIEAISTFNKKELKKHLVDITRANIATRNFPLSVAELRKRLKLKEGGNNYVFATTLADGSHVLMMTNKEARASM